MYHGGSNRSPKHRICQRGHLLRRHPTPIANERGHRVFCIPQTLQMFLHRVLQRARNIPSRTAQGVEKTHRSKLSFSGAIGPTDLTRLHWACCPYVLQCTCIGEEGYLTIAYYATVNEGFARIGIGYHVDSESVEFLLLFFLKNS